MAFPHKYYFLYPDIIIKAVYLVFKMVDLVILEKYILQTGLEVMIVVYLHQKVERKMWLLSEKILAQDTTIVHRKFHSLLVFHYILCWCHWLLINLVVYI